MKPLINIELDNLKYNDFANFINDKIPSFYLEEKDFKKLIQFLKHVLKENNRSKIEIKRFALLTEKEKEVLEHVISGKTTKQVANILFIQPTTVSTHRKKISRKLGTSSVLLWKAFFEDAIQQD